MVNPDPGKPAGVILRRRKYCQCAVAIVFAAFFIAMNSLPVTSTEIADAGNRLLRVTSFGWPFAYHSTISNDDERTLLLEIKSPTPSWRQWEHKAWRLGGAVGNLLVLGFGIYLTSRLLPREPTFSVRFLFVFVVGVSIFLGILRREHYERRIENEFRRMVPSKGMFSSGYVAAPVVTPSESLVRSSHWLSPNVRVWGVWHEAWTDTDKNTQDLLNYVDRAKRLRLLSLYSGSQLRPPDLVPIGRLRDIEYLEIRNFSLTSNDCSFLADLATLRVLKLPFTNVDDSLAKEIECLRRLMALDLRSSRAGDTIARVALKRNSLVSLDLSDTKITDNGLLGLENQAQLEELYVAGTELSDEVWKRIEVCMMLRKLDISQTNISLRKSSKLKKYPELHCIVLDERQLADDGLRVLSTIPTVRELTIVQDVLNANILPALSRLPLTSVVLAPLWNGNINDTQLDDSIAKLIASSELAAFTKSRPNCVVSVQYPNPIIPAWEIVAQPNEDAVDRTISIRWN